MTFSISQHSRDKLLISKKIPYFECGIVEEPKGRYEARFVVYIVNDILTKLIPFFQKYPLQGVKNQDFLDFEKVANLIKIKSHLSSEGLQKICHLKAGMNKARIYSK
jgi:hypothetical protein